ncbi:amino acid transporter [Cohnella kolymensis]|uniref:Amino acid transporter n=1 Tax=Cohnella kolymensis TaxID=1590652 RepID=A0ABR5A0J8_9BACL|nr:LysE family transporter [Cohnella kolymensis]KIL34520.1 amino acid transporter [Cohnella kolymensis]
MTVFLSYLLLGLSISAPLGPINAAQIDRGLKSGFLHAWLIGLGAMAADIFYMILVFFGVIHFINQPFIKTFLWLFGAFVLIYTGFESLMAARNPQLHVAKNSQSHWKTLITGFLMSVSSPLSILFWLGIYGSVLAQSAAASNQTQLIIYSSGIIAGLILWDLGMACVASAFRKLLTNSLMSAISVLSGLSLLGFGGYFGIQAFRILFG